MPTENRHIRLAARAADIPLWRIAKHIGVSEPTMTRWFREPLNAEREAKVLRAISELSKEDSR